MSKRQFTILVVLSALVLSSVLFLLFRPCYNCSKSGITEKNVNHGGSGAAMIKPGTTLVHGTPDATGTIFVLVKKDYGLLNSTGSPAPNVFIELLTPSPIPGSFGQTQSLVTSPSGIANFALTTGPYLLRATNGVFQRQFTGTVDSASTDTVLIIF